MNMACAAGIGAVSGLRSMAGPAIVAEAASRNLLHLKKTPLAWLASDRAARWSAMMAVGEMIVDKLPSAPDRTNIGPLAARAVAGALCGYAICGNDESRSTALRAAGIGALAALAASYIGIQFRRKLPSVVTALIEDAVTLGTGAAVIRAVSE